MNRQRLQTGLWAAGAGLVVALGQAIPCCLEGRLPQVQGEDVLSLVLGDARLEFSRTLADKAEDYFHGGVKHPACPRQPDAAAHTHAAHGQAGHDAHADDDDHEDGHDDTGRQAAGGDLWQWIDGRVHVQAHRELKGAQTVELLPWFWAATRMSPRNVQAYESAAFVLSYSLEKPEEGVRLLEEGVRNNPASPQLDFFLGEVLFNRLHDAARAEPCFTAAREKCLRMSQDEAKADDLLLLRLKAVFYLGYIAKQRGDLSRVRACLAEAEALAPNHQVTHDLRVLLETSGTKQ